MLTFNFDRLSLKPGDRVIDIGAGNGRHSFEALRRGAGVIALDHEPEDLATATAMAAAMVSAGEAPATGGYRGVSGDAFNFTSPMPTSIASSQLRCSNTSLTTGARSTRWRV